MRIVVTGDCRKNSILLDTKEATGLLIETDDGQPTVIYKMLDTKGWMRLVKGEDKHFDDIAKELGLLK